MHQKNRQNTSLAAPGALAHRLQQLGQNPECSDQKTYLAKVTRNAQLDPFPDLSPRRSARIKKLAAPGALAHRLFFYFPVCFFLLRRHLFS